MRKYVSIFHMKLIAGMQYRAAAWAGIATQFFFGFVYIMIYLAFYRGAKTPPSMPVDQLISYMWLQQAFLAIIMLWWQDGDLLSSIKNGDVAYELCRPYNMFSFWFARLTGSRLSNALMRCFPILAIAFILPAPYNMALPDGMGAGMLFLVSLALSLILVVAISMFIYIVTFVTLSQVAGRLIIGVASEFFMGAVIPIPLMPEGLQEALNWLPFRYTSDLPFRIYSGNIAGFDAVFQIGIQFVWIVLLIWLGSISFRRIMKKIVIQRG